MYLEIITPDKKLYSGDVKLIHFPGSQGEFEVMDKHAPIISTLRKGQLWIKPQEGLKQTFDVMGGVVEVLQNKVIVLAEV